jgi:membrane-associated phospholipid phosphatase
MFLVLRLALQYALENLPAKNKGSVKNLPLTFPMKPKFTTWLLILLLAAGIPTVSCGQSPRNADDRLFLEMQGWRNASNEGIFSLISLSTAPVSGGIPALMGLMAHQQKDSVRFRKSLAIAGAAVLGFGFSQILKPLIARPRPDQYFISLHPAGPATGTGSMPSSNSSTAFATATALSLEYPQWQVIVPSFLWAGSVGVSRIVLAHHYPGDVLCGAVLGAGCAWLTHAIQKKLICPKKPVR